MSQINDHAAVPFSFDISSGLANGIEQLEQLVRDVDPALACVYFDRVEASSGLADACNKALAGVQVLGCSSAGEIAGAEGYKTDSLTGYLLPKASGVRAAVRPLYELHSLTTESAAPLIRDLRDELPGADPTACFALLMVDGLSCQEERVAYALQHALGPTPLVGGSAADALRFEKTVVLTSKGPCSAAIALVHSPKHPFRPIKTQHFVATDTKLIVTAAEPEARRVMEINGIPAAEEYADALGLQVSDLDSSVYAANPLLVQIAGQMHVRAVQRAEADGSLYVYCAIDEGLVLALGQGSKFVDGLDETLGDIQKQLGPDMNVLAFDCMFRRLESKAQAADEALARVFDKYNVFGFNTYGEQFGSVHINQTFTGVALG